MPIPVSAVVGSPGSTRRRFPDEGSRFVYANNGSGLPIIGKAGQTLYVFTDAGTTAATDLQTETGAAITTGTLTIDSDSLIPIFYGPSNLTDTLWVRVGLDGDLIQIWSRYDDRLDTLEASLGALSTITDVGALLLESEAATDYVAKVKMAINSKDYAVGNGIADDTVALANALVAARGKSLFLADGIYNTTAELFYDAAAHGPIKIFGSPNAIIKLTGATNKGIRVTGTPGVTRAKVTLEGFQILGATSGVSPAAIHLDGIADYQLHNIIIGPTAKFTTGVTFSGAQQGEWSGGYVEAATVGKFELSGAVASNGCDMHGVSGIFSVAGLTFAGVDTAFIRGNHLTGTGPVGIDVLSSGLGQLYFGANHIELTTTAAFRLGASSNQCIIIGNSCFGNAGSKDLIVNGGAKHTIIGNLFNRDVELNTPASQIVFLGNLVLAGFADTTTNAIVLGNSGNAGGGILSRTGLLFATGNASIGNSTGATFIDSGGGGAINLRVGGLGASLTIDGAGKLVLMNQTIGTTSPAAGGAGALPATPAGYVTVPINGTSRQIPYY